MPPGMWLMRVNGATARRAWEAAEAAHRLHDARRVREAALDLPLQRHLVPPQLLRQPSSHDSGEHGPQRGRRLEVHREREPLGAAARGVEQLQHVLLVLGPHGAADEGAPVPDVHRPLPRPLRALLEPCMEGRRSGAPASQRGLRFLSRDEAFVEPRHTAVECRALRHRRMQRQKDSAHTQAAGVHRQVWLRTCCIRRSVLHRDGTAGHHKPGRLGRRIRKGRCSRCFVERVRAMVPAKRHAHSVQGGRAGRGVRAHPTLAGPLLPLLAARCLRPPARSRGCAGCRSARRIA